MLSLYYQMISFLEMDFHQAAYNLYNIDSNLHTMNSMVYCDYMAPQKLQKKYTYVHIVQMWDRDDKNVKFKSMWFFNV